MPDLTAELKARLTGERPADAPPVFVFIVGLHKFKKLRHEHEGTLETFRPYAMPDSAWLAQNG